MFHVLLIYNLVVASFVLLIDGYQSFNFVFSLVNL